MPKDFEILFFTYAMWSFHLSLLSIITPQKNVDFTHCIDLFIVSFCNTLQLCNVCFCIVINDVLLHA